MNPVPPPMVQDEVPQTSVAEDGGTLHPSLLLSFSSAQNTSSTPINEYAVEPYSKAAVAVHG